MTESDTTDTDRFSPEYECELCRPLDYRGEEINGKEGVITIQVEDGRKHIHCCEECAYEMFGSNNWISYEEIDNGRPGEEY